ncbi:MAG: alpha amylase C-terminal domain-containing protein, partial [Planctomycetia bacterium]|nr:alpha amylase C-terminal domain-containing protein [Planctomycetia bacterium]
LAYQACHPGKKLTFMGTELAMWEEWNFDGELPWEVLNWGPHSGVQNMVRDLNRLVRREPALHEQDCEPGGFEWIDCNNWEESILVFMRHSTRPEEKLIVAMNFTPVPRWSYRIGVPEPGIWYELFNSDAEYYGGGGVGNCGQCVAESIPMHGRPASMTVHVPPLGVVVFRRNVTE